MRQHSDVMQELQSKISRVCFFVLCNRHWFNFTVSSLADAGCADLPLPFKLLGAPVDIGALVKLGSRSRE